MAKIINRPPPLTKKIVTCKDCHCEFEVSQSDVKQIQYEKTIRLEDLGQTFWGNFRELWADGFAYKVSCPVCSRKNWVYDHLTNIRVVSYSSD